MPVVTVVVVGNGVMGAFRAEEFDGPNGGATGNHRAAGNDHDAALPSRRPREVSEIVGQSALLAEVRERVLIAAKSDFNVLITGETGTGKELVAREIHRLSRRRDKPLISHNCGATPRGLFESHFFGHKRGSFTGADSDRVGLIESARDSDLFLDELEALPLDHQAKLLRVIEEGEIQPVGSQTRRAVSVRYLAATNRNLIRMVKAGTFRKDLFYRLADFEIWLPPLRRHPEDIAILVDHFLGAETKVTADAMKALEAHRWPGNVRELRSVLKAARAIADRDGAVVITPRHLAEASRAFTEGREVSEEGFLVSGRTLKDLIEKAIRKAYHEARGNQTLAAQRLGISRATLQRKLAEFGIINPKEHLQ